MRKLTEADRSSVMAYIMKEPEYNLFMIGDIEQFGFDGDIVEVFANEIGGEFDFILLRFLKYYIFYSHHLTFQVDKAIQFFNSRDFDGISGKGDILGALVKHMNVKRKDTYLARLNQVPYLRELPSEIHLKRLTEKDGKEIVDVYLLIEEFADPYQKRTYEDNLDAIKKQMSTGRIYGIYKGNQLVSLAATSAENSVSAMIIGVATLKPWRGKGYAGYGVAKLCRDILKEGKKFICLFYNNPQAGRIYHRIGFQDIGIYVMVSKE